MKSKIDQNKETLRSTTPSPFRVLLHLYWGDLLEERMVDPAMSHPFCLYSHFFQNFVSGVNMSSNYHINFFTAYELLVLLSCLCYFNLLMMLFFELNFI